MEGSEISNGVPPSTSSTDINECKSLKDKVNRILADKCSISMLVDKLFESGMLVHYIAHFQQLATGTLSPKNVAVLFVLERAYWQMLQSTTNMTYDGIMKKWYAVCQKLFGTSLINMCSGDKNFGQVICNDTTKGKYSPMKSKINFAVPHRRHLVAVSKEFPKIVKPGLIPEGLNMIRNQTDLVLMVDCKKVARGLEDDFCGDVQLFGYEEPNVDVLKRSLQRDCIFYEKFLSDLENLGREQLYDKIMRCFNIITHCIECVRDKQQKQKTLLMRYEAKVVSTGSSKEKQDLQFPISKLKTYLYLSFLWIKKCLHTIGELCKISARLLGMQHLLKLEGICDLSHNPNVNLLHDVGTVRKFCLPNSFARITQQGTDQWKNNRKLSLVTGSTIYSALGF